MVFGGDRRDRDGDREPKEGGADSGFLFDVIRRAVHSSIQTVFSSDEGRRNLVSALMPRELIHSVMQQIDGTKREAIAIIGREMQQFLSNLNVGQELTKILTSVTFEIKTEVRFIPNEDGTLRSDVKTSVGPRVVTGKARGGEKAAARSKAGKAAQAAGRPAAKRRERKGDKPSEAGSGGTDERKS